MKKLLFILIIFIVSNQVFGQGIHTIKVTGGGGVGSTSQWRDTTGGIYYPLGSASIGTTLANTSAQLDVQGTTKGVLLPRLTNAQMLAIATPANGLMVTNTDSSNRIFIYTGSIWRGLTFTNQTAANITGLVTQGTNVTVTGSGTTGSPYVVNSISSGGITGIGVATRIPFWNGASSLTSDTSFRYSPTGSLYSTKMYAGMVLNPVVASAANLDTLVALQIDPIYNVGANTGVIKQTLKIEKTYFNVDSLYNFSWGNGNAAANQVYGNTLFLGKNAGAGATGAYQAIMLGIDVGVNATNATNSVFLGNGAGNGATNANTSFFVGANAGYGATGANNSNFLGNGAGNGATTASYANYLGVNAGYQAVGSGSSNFFGAQAGYNATGASSSNFLGSNAGQNATNSSTSNFFGLSAGQDAVSSLASNFMGYDAGHYSTNSDNSNFYGRGAGFRALSAPFSNFFGTFSGQGSSGASYSNFFGFNTGDSTNFKITGTNNILLGTNITTPAAASTNTLNIGNVLYGTNLYSNTTGNPASAAQTTGQIGINVTTPATSAVLDVTSTTKGFLKPRMTTTQKNAIATPAEGLTVYDLTLHQMSYYNGTAWINY